MNQIVERIALLREAMNKNGVFACIIPGTDPHASEYFAEHWKEREWISGFNGSAGTAVVTTDKAALWTDSRYFLQAAEQLKNTTFELMKDGLPDTLGIVAWLVTQLKNGAKVGVNAQMFSHNAFESMKSDLKLNNIELIAIDLISDIWKDRPEIPNNKLFIFDTKYSGQTAADKLKSLRNELQKAHADVFPISALDDIAWLFNIRGNDVNYNPLVIAYALVDTEKALLFIDEKKITSETKQKLENQGVEIKSYLDIYKNLKEISPEKAVFIDGNKLNESLFGAIPATCTVRNGMSPVFKLKAAKNEVELNGIRAAMLKDGVALVRFFKWLEENTGKTKNLTEISIADKLHNFRAEQENFVGDSFATIAGFAAHGAIVHYSATPETDVKIKAENILLLDSGGQYLEGTTDITRTIALGTPSVKQKNDYTLVLKGHIALATAVFPVGTRGSQLDILARKALWDKGLSYGHGTGHGVGHFLCVHEGPQNIRMEENPTVLQPGMVISNEPGLYRADEYGIRIENLITVVEAEKTDFGQFLKFETLTLCPIDTQLINSDLLNKKEIKWLNDYHEKVFEKLTPQLSEDERDWLSAKCKPVKANV